MKSGICQAPMRSVTSRTVAVPLGPISRRVETTVAALSRASGCLDAERNAVVHRCQRKLDAY